MAIAQNTLPAVPPDFTLPLDASLQFASTQTLTATGYVNNTTAQIQVNPGRLTGFLALDITAMAVGSSDEYYRFLLMGSNDVNWGNGNIATLAFAEFNSASSNALVTTITGAFPTVPPAGRGGWLRAVPFTNYIGGGYVFQYMKLYLVTGGTSPSVTLSAWITPFEMRV
jgi:hypothetical protein